jgi:hypothetical protein
MFLQEYQSDEVEKAFYHIFLTLPVSPALVFQNLQINNPDRTH